MSRPAACSQPAAAEAGGTAAASAPSADRAPLATTWQISNWPHFIDTDSDGTHPTLTAFDSRYDTDTVYTEDITSNEAAAAKYAPMLAEGEDIGQDAIVLSDWMAYQWIHAGYAQRLDPALLPHVNSLRIPPLRKRPIDPDDEFLIPWQAGLTGVIYDPAKTNGELSRVNDLFDPLFPGKITLLDNMRDTLGLVLMAMHVAPESASPDAGAGRRRQDPHRAGRAGQGAAVRRRRLRGRPRPGQGRRGVRLVDGLRAAGAGQARRCCS